MYLVCTNGGNTERDSAEVWSYSSRGGGSFLYKRLWYRVAICRNLNLVATVRSPGVGNADAKTPSGFSNLDEFQVLEVL